MCEGKALADTVHEAESEALGDMDCESVASADAPADFEEEGEASSDGD